MLRIRIWKFPRKKHCDGGDGESSRAKGPHGYPRRWNHHFCKPLQLSSLHVNTLLIKCAILVFIKLQSSGDLASSESTAQQLIHLVQHALPVNFNTEDVEGAVGGDPPPPPTNNHAAAGNFVNGDNPNSNSATGQVWKWNRLTGVLSTVSSYLR